MKKTNRLDDEFLDLILFAIGNSIFAGDTIIGYDGFRYFWDEADGSNMTSGYVIKQGEIAKPRKNEDWDDSEKADEHQKWLAAVLYYHANNCLAHFDEQIKNN